MKNMIKFILLGAVSATIGCILLGKPNITLPIYFGICLLDAVFEVTISKIKERRNDKR
jgi:hypothetical protein